MALLLKDCPDLVVKNNELARLVPWPWLCHISLGSEKGRRMSQSDQRMNRVSSVLSLSLWI